MKKYLLLLISHLILFASPAAAQTAKSVLDKTASTLSSYPSVTANFHAALGGRGGTTGTITLQGRKFFVQGAEALVWFDGQTQWMLLPSTNEVNITTPTPQELQQMNPYYFLNLYKSGYDLTLRTEGPYDIVTMKAQRKAGIKEMEVTIQRSTHLPARVKMTSQRGTVSTIAISNIHRGKRLPDSRFQFRQKEYPKAQIIDLR